MSSFNKYVLDTAVHLINRTIDTKGISDIGKLHITKQKCTDDGHLFITLTGGANGHGKWSEYTEQLNILMNETKDVFRIIKLDIDNPDDVWDVVISTTTSKFFDVFDKF